MRAARAAHLHSITSWREDLAPMRQSNGGFAQAIGKNLTPSKLRINSQVVWALGIPLAQIRRPAAGCERPPLSSQRFT